MEGRVIPIFPKDFFEKFVEEHPVQAVLVVLFGVAMAWFLLWMVVFK
jgi:hypothetical protein